MKSILVPGVFVVLTTTVQVFGQETGGPPYRVTHPAPSVTCF